MPRDVLTDRALDRAVFYSPILPADWKPFLVVPPALVEAAREFWGTAAIIVEQKRLGSS